MSELVDQLADLTGFRDRDVLDVTLVGAFRDLLRPLSVAIYRSVGEAGDERWLTRARLGEHDVAASADSAWTDLEQLPRRTHDAARLEAFERRCVVTVPGAPHRSLFPVATDREVVGVLEIQTDEALDLKDQRLVASILRIYRNFQALLDYSEHDTLTGLLNRKTFDESFMKAASEPRPEGPDDGEGRRRLSGTHWLGVVDIDHFKRVNDTCGHLIGDEVLLLVSRLMRAGFRFHDRLYRFGGEEFVVLMRCAHGEAAMAAFERLRVLVERYVFPQAGHITVSVGYTEVRPVDTPNAAFERADRAVYYAKAHGRNRVCSHSELVARGELVEGDAVSDVELF